MGVEDIVRLGSMKERDMGTLYNAVVAEDKARDEALQGT